MKQEYIELKCPNCNCLMKKIKISGISNNKLELICKKCNHPISITLNKSWSCDKCGKKFKTKEEVKSHETGCNKEQQKSQFFCPYCDSEIFSAFNPLGEIGEMICGDCNKKFKFAFGKVVHAVGFTGYVAKQGFLRMIINGKEEEISWYSDNGIDLKINDLILIIWKKKLFNQNKPYQISNYTTGVRNQL